ncbi:MAG: T9SS type A sorting domain-containing protein [Balneolaceae bacterium]
MKRELFGLFLVMFAFSGYGQKVVWEKSIGGQHSEYLFDMTSTVDYGFLLAGSSLSDKTGTKKIGGQGSLDYFLWKMDQNGEEEWQWSIGGDGQDILKSIAMTSDVGYILGGYSDSDKGDYKLVENKGGNDLWVVKINAKEGVEWQAGYGGTGDDRLVEIQQTSDGGYIIVASTNSPASEEKQASGFGGLDIWVIKTDNKGKVEWEKTFGGLYNDEPRSILQTDKGFIIGAVSNSPVSGNKRKEGFGGYDWWILELDFKGQLMNEHVFGSNQDDELNSLLIIESDEGYLLTGNTFATEANGNFNVAAATDSDFLVVKTDLNFVSQKQYTFDLNGSEFLTSTVLLDNDNFLLSGYKVDKKSRKKSYVSIQVDGEGDVVWKKELSTDGDDLLRKAVVTRDGGIVFAGNSDGIKSAHKKTVQGRNDYWIVKLHTRDELRKPEIKIEAFPNPTDGFTQIVINHEYKEGTVHVFDLNGRLLHSEELKYDMVIVDLSDYASGTYVINVKTNIINTSVKVIKK